MCGIIGYAGPRKAAPILIGGLSKLEYRGYDSAGIAVLSGNEVQVVKTEGRLKVLSDMTDGGESVEGFVGIGHTRWATHGAPSDINSHPHMSHNGRIAVVHNGIIENYKKLKQQLIHRGYSFVSDTDTEVIVHLIDYYWRGNMLSAISRALARLEGSYAIGIISSDHPDEMFAVRKSSPLIVGLGKGESFIASDIPAVLESTKDVYFLDDNEIVWLKKDGSVKVMDSDRQEIKKEVFHVTWDAESAEKGGYEHFMLKEIFEQPTAVRETVNPRIKDGRVFLEDFKLTDEQIRELRKIYVVGCGSAYHAGVVGSYVMEDLAKISTEVELASEFRYRSPLLSKDDLVIAISQSGETADTLAAMREAKRVGAKVLGIVNVVGSSVAREADFVLYTWAGPEISVATTKAYSTQLQILYLLAIHFASVRGFIDDECHKNFVAELQKLPEKIEKILAETEPLAEYASRKYNARNVFFMGRGLDYCLALEASLKLKEISYINSQAIAAGELKHGTISLIDEGTCVAAVVTQSRIFDKTVSNIHEVASRGAVVFAVTDRDSSELQSVCDFIFRIPETDDMLKPALAAVAFQIFAYYVAVCKGCDVDKPRNLAKSVTVE